MGAGWTQGSQVTCVPCVSTCALLSTSGPCLVMVHVGVVQIEELEGTLERVQNLLNVAHAEARVRAHVLAFHLLLCRCLPFTRRPGAPAGMSQGVARVA